MSIQLLMSIAFLIIVIMSGCNEQKNVAEEKLKDVEQHLEIKTIESVKGNYRVDIPKEFVTIKEDSSIVGTDKKLQAKSYSSMSEIKGSAVLVSSAHYSETRFTINSKEEILEQSGSELLRTLEAHSIKYTPIKHGGLDGVEINFRTSQGDTTYYGKARVLARTPTIYYLTFLSDDSTLLNKKEVSHFFSSLRALR